MLNCTQSVNIGFDICTIPLGLATLFRFLCHRCPRSQVENFYNYGALIGNIFRLLIILPIMLKFEETFEATWSDVLVPFWIGFVLMVITSFLLFFFLMSFIVLYIQEEIEMKAVIGNLWMFLVVGGL